MAWKHYFHAFWAISTELCLHLFDKATNHLRDKSRLAMWSLCDITKTVMICNKIYMYCWDLHCVLCTTRYIRKVMSTVWRCWLLLEPSHGYMLFLLRHFHEKKNKLYYSGTRFQIHVYVILTQQFTIVDDIIIASRCL